MPLKIEAPNFEQYSNVFLMGVNISKKNNYELSITHMFIVYHHTGLENVILFLQVLLV